MKNNNLTGEKSLNNSRTSSTDLRSVCSSKKETSKPLSRLEQVSKLRNPKNSNLSRSVTKSQSIPLTPAKKRSSLARPVRVHDSFNQSRKVISAGYTVQPQQQQQQQQQQLLKKQQDQLQQPNSSDYGYEDEEHGDEDANWPIRLRLEQMLELTLPQTKGKKKKTPMMLMKQEQRNKHVCKDTERLLKVLSINNVDQDNRYNVKRCSVM